MNPSQRATLRSAIDRIIPADDWPSASENHVDDFIDTLTATTLVAWRQSLLDGLDALERAAGNFSHCAFIELQPAQQDKLLEDFEKDASHQTWFATLVRLTNEGYYTDASRGSNREHISWKMVGYDPRLPKESR